MPRVVKRKPTKYQIAKKSSKGRCDGTVSATEHRSTVADYKANGLAKAKTAADRKKVERIAKTMLDSPCKVGKAVRKKKTVAKK